MEPDPGSAAGDHSATPDARLAALRRTQSEEGSPAAELLPLVYEELRSLARRLVTRLRPGQTLQPTVLVHEAYLRLLGGEESRTGNWQGRRHFFAAAARAMRHIAIDAIRRKSRIRHGGGREHLSSTEDVVLVAPISNDVDDSMMLALDGALDALERDVGARAVEVVMLRYFVGMTVPEVAFALGVTSRTVDRDWRFARAWLHDRLAGALDG